MLTDLIVLAFLKIAPRHGYDIRKHVDRILTGPRKLNTNLLYPSLHRLEKLGAVQREDCEQSGKRSRHMYRITAEGEKRFLEMISDFGDTEAEKDEEFTVRVAFFEFINRTNRQAILERRREVLRKRVALRRSRQESLLILITDRKNNPKKFSAVNILRLGLLLVILGFFLPVACHLNGHQVAQGILGHAQPAWNASLLGSMDNAYGFLLYCVYGFALMGLLLTLVVRTMRGYHFGLSCLAVSLVLLIVILLKLQSVRDTPVVDFFITVFQIKFTILIGGYSMGMGYLAGIVGFALKLAKKVH